MLLSSCGFACRLLGSAEAAALAASPLARMTDVAFGSKSEVSDAMAYVRSDPNIGSDPVFPRTAPGAGKIVVISLA
jgi:hypothetical protein